MSETSLRILIAEDHEIVRVGTVLILNEMYSNVQIDETENFDRAVDLIARNKYDLVILDINIPGGDNINMISVVKLKQPNIKILIFSSYDEQIYAMRYFKAGANGYLAKDTNSSEIKKAITKVLSGGTYISEAAQVKLFESIVKKDNPKNPIDTLSNREIEVMNLLIQGKSTSEISTILNLHIATVSTYKSRLFEKLEVNNVIDLATKAKIYGEE